MMLNRNSIVALIGLSAAFLNGCNPTTAPRVRSLGPVAVDPVPEGPPYTDMSIPSQDARVPVIMYHDIIEKRGRGSVWFDCTAAEFETQMQTLKDRGAVPITLDQLYDHLTKGTPVPPKAIVLTFDDNYQGYYDNAVPILRKYGYPSAMFVHTKFVGDKTGSHPKMTYDTLRELCKDAQITIGSHTVSHPDDIRILSPDLQKHELVDSKAALEKELGRKIPYLAYPDGKNDSMVQTAARDAGYTMAFSIENTLAEDSPNIMSIGRYVHTRLDRAIDAQDRETVNVPAAVAVKDIKTGPVSLKGGSFAGVQLALVVGGTPESIRSAGRQTVGDFVKQEGAVAGINGTFFNLASISGTDNGMVGPVQTSNEKRWVADDVQERWAKIQDRPLVVWGPKRIAFVPFQPGPMEDGAAVKSFMPDFTDVFVGGAWIVHAGVPQTAEQMDAHSSKDIHDPRHRAFFGVNRDGMIVLGASLGSVSTEAVARAAAEAGVEEAVLLDSGFSTSLIFGSDIIATGHSTIDNPSRPVPHAIVLKGELGTRADIAAQVGPANPDGAQETNPRPRRHRRKRKVRVSTPDAPPAEPAPATDPPGKKRKNASKSSQSESPDDASAGGIKIPPR